MIYDLVNSLMWVIEILILCFLFLTSIAPLLYDAIRLRKKRRYK